ncbi:hypothetical protein FOL47_001032 [Perkinsus chesapeaki]|uniref:Uncharacterized protein n=2 Tax=Alveolata TaxID=33630 RepID=A0A7J6KTT1_PERCH|nr:hypothetical protein FOL47_001032 [Perkinsus chesapeaki]
MAAEPQNEIPSLEALMEARPDLRNINIDQYPSDRLINDAFGMPEEKRLPFLLSTPLKVYFSHSDEKIDPEGAFILSDFVRALLRWAVAISLITCYDNGDGLQMGELTAHIGNCLLATNMSAYSGKIAGPTGSAHYHQLTVCRLSESVRRGGDKAALVAKIIDFDENLGIKTANKVITVREKQSNNSCSNWKKRRW